MGNKDNLKDNPKGKVHNSLDYIVEDEDRKDRKSNFEMERYDDEYGIDPSKIRAYRTNKKGEVVFLCSDNESYYTIKASKKTDDWSQAVSEYRKEN